jgi:hypothetical protein
MNNINIHNPNKKDENIKALNKLMEKVKNLRHRTSAKCYENKTNAVSKYYCVKRSKLDGIIEKIKEIITKLNNMNNKPSS